MVRVTLVCAAAILLAVPLARAQEPTRAEGWVVIPVDEYRALRLRAYPPARPPDPPPVDATLSRVEYDLRVDGNSAVGEARLTVDVLKDGWVRIDVPAGVLVRGARVDGRPVALVTQPAPHILLSRPGRVIVALDVVVRARATSDADALTLPPSPGAVSRVALVIPRAGIDIEVSGGVLTERPQQVDARWVAFGRAGQPLTLTWKRRTQTARVQQPLKWRGAVTEVLALGEEASPVTATVRVEVTQGTTTSVEAAVPDGMTVNQVSGALVADWDFRPGVLTVTFLEPVATQTSFAIAAEARMPRDGAVTVPLLRLPGAERETGGVAIEVLGAGEIRGQQARGLDPADASELGDPVTGRESNVMAAFRYRPQDGRSARALTVTVARYTPHAVLIANVEEARFDALVAEEGKMLVRARYAVRNNQRSFLGILLPPGATLWSAAVAARPVRPGVAAGGGLLVPLEKGRSGDETPAFPVEITYVQQGETWHEKGRTTITLPAIDLPVSRAGVVLHHSPRFRVTPERGAFRVEPDPGPFTEALRTDAAAGHRAADPGAPPAPAAADELVAQFRKEAAGVAVTGPLPLHVPFPDVGPALFLVSELMPESKAPTLAFSYKRGNLW